MDPKWLDQDRVDQETKAVEFSELTYDPDLGHYCFSGESFTGAVTQRYPDGKLRNVVHLADGVSTRVSVGWYPNGQIERYSEMPYDAIHGLHIEWAEDGT